MKAITLEDWQIKSLRNYFGENDSTQTSHWAYKIFNEAKDIPESDPNEEMESIRDVLSACEESGLILEVLQTAFKDIQTDPSTSIQRALYNALYEWDVK